MAMRILAVNLGSSSLKLDLWDTGKLEPITRLAARGVGETRGTVAVDGETAAETEMADHGSALESLFPRLPEPERIDRVGHRVVHGGPHRHTAWLTDALRRELSELVPLSPVHLPPAIEVIGACMERLPRQPQAAVFDTAFHAGLPEHARRYAVPARWHEAGVRRYGFHGIACADVVTQLGTKLARHAVLLHLGAGCSATALLEGRSVDTTMGLTPLEGLVMATRSGDVDPGALIYLLREHGLSLDELDRGLNHDSGLRGLSGFSDDMKTLLERRADEPAAALAVEVFCYRAAKTVAALGVALGGLDQLIFSGGIGEHAAPVRARVAEQLTWLGLALDADANAAHRPVLSATGSTVEVRMVTVDEGREIARETAELSAP
ncbi:MAG: acetate/propionate family kinase [Gammaproteobacteria bacterium]